jgi:hypothetical protein
MVPGYLKTFRQAIRKPTAYEINEKNETRGPEEGFNSFNSFNSYPLPLDINSRDAPRQGVSDDLNFPYQVAFDALERRCPEFVPSDRWQQAVEDSRQFLATWGEQAQGYGWTVPELFGLHPVPERPAASYQRLSRYDETGLIWLLRGRPVVALTETTAAIQGAASIITYRKLNKPGMGPLGDSLDDLGPCA